MFIYFATFKEGAKGKRNAHTVNLGDIMVSGTKVRNLTFVPMNFLFRLVVGDKRKLLKPEVQDDDEDLGALFAGVSLE